MPNITKISDIDVSKLNFSNPWINKSGGQTVFVTDHRDKKIIFSTPLCKAPFGISSMNNRSSITFNVSPDNDKQNEFATFLSQLDLHVMSHACTMSTSWFKKSLDPSRIAQMYNPCLKNKNERYDPVFRARLPTNENGEFQGDIYDMDRKIIPQSSITNGCSIEAIVELTGIYFIANDFGVSWKILQLKVKPNTVIKGYAFLDEESEEEKSDAEPN